MSKPINCPDQTVKALCFDDPPSLGNIKCVGVAKEGGGISPGVDWADPSNLEELCDPIRVVKKPHAGPGAPPYCFWFLGKLYCI